MPEGKERGGGKWTTHLIMLQAVDHELRKDNDAGPPHPCTAVDYDRWVPGLDAFQDTVGVTPD